MPKSDIKFSRRVVNTEKTSAPWKRTANRRFRRLERLALRTGKNLPKRLREVSDAWDLS